MFDQERVSTIHASNAIRHYFHHMSGEVWSLLNERIESLDVDGEEPAFGASDYGCTPWTMVNQGQFSKNRSPPGGFDYLIPDKYIRFAFDQDEHYLAGVSSKEHRLPCRNRLNVRVLTKQFDEVHVYLLQSSRQGTPRSAARDYAPWHAERRGNDRHSEGPSR